MVLVAESLPAEADAGACAAADPTETRELEKQHLKRANAFDGCWMPWAMPSAADKSVSKKEQ